MGLKRPGEPEVTAARMAAAGLRTFFRISDRWGLSVEEQITLLGSPARSTYYRWRKDGADALSQDVLERLSYVLGIWKALQILLPDEVSADAWVRKPNDAEPFGGRSALDRMLSGHVADLYEVRRYLDGQRG